MSIPLNSSRKVMKQGLIHVYTGDGKGKTTAALGLLLRAYGRGMKVVLVQFLKGSDTGEIHSLKKLPDITVLRLTRDFGFFPYANAQDQQEMTRQNNTNLAEASRLAGEGLCDLLVLDEICAAYHNGAIDTALADELILRKPSALEIILTGRNAPPHFVEAAGYVTEFVGHKHPFEQGIPARDGIEF